MSAFVSGVDEGDLQTTFRGVDGQAGDLDRFAGVGLARDDGDLRAGEAEDFCEEFFDGAVGFAVFWGLGDFDFDRVAEEAGEGGAAGVGDNLDVQLQRVVFGLEMHDASRELMGV